MDLIEEPICDFIWGSSSACPLQKTKDNMLCFLRKRKVYLFWADSLHGVHQHLSKFSLECFVGVVDAYSSLDLRESEEHFRIIIIISHHCLLDYLSQGKFTFSAIFTFPTTYLCILITFFTALDCDKSHCSQIEICFVVLSETHSNSENFREISVNDSTRTSCDYRLITRSKRRRGRRNL